MSAAVAIYSFKKKSKNFFWIAVFSFFFQNQAQAFLTGKDCGEDIYRSYISQVNTMCNAGPLQPAAAAQCAAEQSCGPTLKAMIEKCQSTVINDFAALQQANTALGDVQAGNFGSATTQLEGGTGNLTGSTITNGAPTGGACTGSLGASAQRQISSKKNIAALDAGNAAGNAAGTAAGTGGLLGDLKGPLLGAAAGGLLGYMLGNKGEEESSSSESSAPKGLDPPPGSEAPPVASSSSSNSSATSVPSVENPAVVTIPTVDPNAEGGSGDSEILIAANDAILTDDGGNVVEESDDGGGTTTLGGTSGGGSTGNTSGDSIVADNGDEAGRDVEDVVVEDDELVLGLVGGSRGLAGGAAFNFGGAESSQGAAGGSGSGMMLGVPTRARPRAGSAASGSSASSRALLRGTASVPSVAGASATVRVDNTTATSAQSSSVAPFRTREQIREDLRRRGLIQ